MYLRALSGTLANNDDWISWGWAEVGNFFICCENYASYVCFVFSELSTVPADGNDRQ